MKISELKIKCFCKQQLTLSADYRRFFDFECKNKNCKFRYKRLIQGESLYYQPNMINEIHIMPNYCDQNIDNISGFYYKYNLDYSNISESFICIDEETLTELIKLDFNQIKQKYHNLLLFK